MPGGPAPVSRAAGAAANMAGSALQGASAFMLPALGQLYSRAASTLIGEGRACLPACGCLLACLRLPEICVCCPQHHSVAALPLLSFQSPAGAAFPLHLPAHSHTPALPVCLRLQLTTQ